MAGAGRAALGEGSWGWGHIGPSLLKRRVSVLSLACLRPGCVPQHPLWRRVCSAARPAVLPVALALLRPTLSRAAEILRGPPTRHSPKLSPHLHHEPPFRGPPRGTGDRRPLPCEAELNRTPEAQGGSGYINEGARDPSGWQTAVPHRATCLSDEGGDLGCPPSSKAFLIPVVILSAAEAGRAGQAGRWGRKRGQRVWGGPRSCSACNPETLGQEWGAGVLGPGNQGHSGCQVRGRARPWGSQMSSLSQSAFKSDLKASLDNLLI